MLCQLGYVEYSICDVPSPVVALVVSDQTLRMQHGRNICNYFRREFDAVLIGIYVEYSILFVDKYYSFELLKTVWNDYLNIKTYKFLD